MLTQEQMYDIGELETFDNDVADFQNKKMIYIFRYNIENSIDWKSWENNLDYIMTIGHNTCNTVWEVIKSKTEEREENWYLSHLDHYWALPWHIVSIDHPKWQWKFTVPTLQTYQDISWDPMKDYLTASRYKDKLTWQDYPNIKLQALRTTAQWSHISSVYLADQNLYTQSWEINYMSTFAKNLKDKWIDINIMKQYRFYDLIILIQIDFWLENTDQAKLAFMYMAGIPYDVRLANDNDIGDNFCHLRSACRRSGGIDRGYLDSLSLIEIM